ncbi:M20/M25/M40 family metallo-hydrolase [Nitrospinae bacterium AH-259-F20]|nr:M20/M25/M40 family metallo-hydrolase [Nitrospinae bacterium AH-259-F20]
MVLPLRFHRLALAIPLSLWVAAVGLAPTTASAFSLIDSHELSVRLEPRTHRLEATDRLSLQGLTGGGTLSLLLHKDLSVRSVKAEPSGDSLAFSVRPGPDHRQEVAVSLGGPFTAPEAIVMTYDGVIHDPVRKAQGMTFARGEATSGLIGPEGIYLDAQTGWYPDTAEGGLARFSVEASVPEPFRVVTQGRLIKRHQDDGRSLSRWSSIIPADGLVLVAGPYRISSKSAGHVVLSTYFLSGSDEAASAYLEAAERYIAFYSELLGPYPFSKFDIVENFFPAGFGMQGFALLEPDVVAQGEQALRPGYLDHEIVHSWWGNYVSAPTGPSNWTEALTTYCADYYWREANEGLSAARAWRLRALQKYAVQAKPDKESPLNAPSAKHEETENDVGYVKGAMVFHMLRRQVGDETFWATLRKMVKLFGRGKATWGDFRRHFEAESGKDLHGFFNQWLRRTGGPVLALRKMVVRPSAGGFLVEGTLAQEGEPYRLAVPVRLEAGGPTKEVTLELAGASVPFAFETNALPRAVAIDPDGHLFRALPPTEVVPSLNALLWDTPALLVVPDVGQDPLWKLYRKLAGQAAANSGATVVTPGQVTEERMRASSVLLFGRVRTLARFQPLAAGLPPWASLEDTTLRVREETFDDPSDAALLVGHNPLNPAHFAGIYVGFSEAALERASSLFYYGWDSVVAFRAGRPIARGTTEPPHTPARYSAALALARPIARGALMEHVRALAGPSLRGRFPGTPGDRQVARYITKQLEQAGFEPVADAGKNRSWRQPFTLTLPDIGFFHLRLTRGDEHRDVESWPVLGSPVGTYKSTIVDVGYGLVTAERDDYAGKSVFGKAVLVRDGFPGGAPEPEGPLQALESKISAAAERGAAVLLVAVSGPLPEAYVPLAAYPSLPSPALRATTGKHKAKGRFSSLPMEIMKLQSRSETIEVPPLPVILLPRAEAWRPWIEAAGEASTTLELNLHYRRRRWSTQNILGYLPGADSILRREIVVLSAHYDAMGPGTRGELFLGADDNASGVAALLEVSRMLARQRQWLKRSLLIVAFGAEEWGMVGSRYYVAHPVRDLARTAALLNADAIAGRTPVALAHLVGRSHYPGLAEAAEGFATEVGLAVGGDIDENAFRFGGDHWPFHRAGVPVLTFRASNDQRMKTAKDTIANIDEEKLERMARLLYLAALELLTAQEIAAHAPAGAP